VEYGSRNSKSMCTTSSPNHDLSAYNDFDDYSTNDHFEDNAVSDYVTGDSGV